MIVGTMAPEWDITLNSRDALGEEAMGDLLERLVPYGAAGTLSCSRGGCSVRLTVEAPEALDAVTRAFDIARDAGFPTERIAAVEAEEAEEAE